MEAICSAIQVLRQASLNGATPVLSGLQDAREKHLRHLRQQNALEVEAARLGSGILQQVPEQSLQVALRCAPEGYGVLGSQWQESYCLVYGHLISEAPGLEAGLLFLQLCLIFAQDYRQKWLADRTLCVQRVIRETAPAAVVCHLCVPGCEV